MMPYTLLHSDITIFYCSNFITYNITIIISNNDLF